MKNIKMMAGAALVGMLIVVPKVTASDGTVSLGLPAFEFFPGGEFTAYTSPQSFLGDYAAVSQVGGGFETFCVQTAVDFSPGTTYNYSLSLQSIGSPGGAVGGLPGTPDNYPLTEGTAWL